MVQKVRHTLYRGESKPGTQLAIARWILQLDKFFEDDLLPFPGDTDTGVTDADAQQLAVSPATDEDLALFGVLDCIAEQVLQDDAYQRRIAVYLCKRAIHPR